ncbi:hypothetical protein N7540_012510 [Penicillium herquei]|nr:hypothetical protein N7540_012510 [Penicillium herquei]
MTSLSNGIGPFIVEEWPRPRSYGIGHHSETLEKVTIKSDISASNLASEVSALQSLAGGIGIPSLYWFGVVRGHKILVTDLQGHSLEEIFHQAGRYFELQILLEFAHQLVFRLEWMHSRQVSYGNLEPASLTLGSSSWQAPQITISNFGNADISKFSARADLEAVGNILLYFATANSSWEEFKRRQKSPVEIPSFLMEFFSAISSPDISLAHYATIRSYFHTARCYLKRTLFGGISDPEKQHLSLRHLSGKTTGDLFELLGTQMSKVGESVTLERSQWMADHAGFVVGFLDDMMAIFLALLMRDKPSHIRRNYLNGAFHLPNRLWRDLRWYLCMASRGSISFQRLITLRIYKYIAVLLEIIPCYNHYWTSYLSDLAYSQMALDSEATLEWRQTWMYWKNCANHIRSKK